MWNKIVEKHGLCSTSNVIIKKRECNMEGLYATEKSVPEPFEVETKF